MTDTLTLTPEQRRLARHTQDWFDLRQAVCAISVGFEPEPLHWLETDGGISYCRKCAVKARALEFDLGAPLLETPWHRRDEWEVAFFDGIAGYPENQAGTSDIIEYCYTCGTPLDYWLTDYGIQEELSYWEGAEFSGNVPEIAYAIDRLFECDDAEKERVRELATRFLDHVAGLTRAGAEAALNPGETLSKEDFPDE